MRDVVSNVELLGAGDRVGGFKLVRRLGRGGYGLVFLAEAPNGRRVAVKLSYVKPGDARAGHIGARVLKEAGLLMLLEHPHVVKLLAYGRHPDPVEGFPYVVMEYVEGPTLREWVRRARPSFREVARVCAEVALALAAAHEAGVMHRDVKASNILIREVDGRAVLVDFGAGDHPFAPEVTRGVLPPGTYRSPEALRFLWRAERQRGERYPYAPTDDLFALGAMLYEVLTGTSLAPELPVELLPHEAYRLPRAPHEANPRVPEALSALALRLLAEWPQGRYQTAAEVHEALRGALASADAAWDAPPFAPPTPGQVSTQEEAALQAGDAEARALERWAREGAPTPAPLEPAPAGTTASSALVLAPLRAVRGWAAVAWAAVLVALVTLGAFTARRHAGATAVSEVAPLVESPQAGAGAAPAPATSTPAPVAPAMPREETTPVNDAKADVSIPTRKAPEKKPLIPRTLKAVGCAAGMACAGAQVRPPPQDCPPGAVQNMRRMGLKEGKGPFVYLDVNQPGGIGQSAMVRTGPITSKVSSNRTAARDLDRALLWGHLWVDKDRIYGRWHAAQLPGGAMTPVCLELTDTYLNEPDLAMLEPGIENWAENVKPPEGEAQRKVGARVVERFK